MYTEIKREDLEEVILGNHELYNMFSLVGDKLRAIYGALGWDWMTRQPSRVDNLVEGLTQQVLEGLNSEEEEIVIGESALTVTGYWDDDNLVLEYKFSL